MRRFLIVLALLSIVPGCKTLSIGSSGWVDLFDGETLKGWKIVGGDADFYAEDGMIICNSKLGIPNAFLCTEKDYDDFILTFDVRIDEGINSGMHIRSHVWDKETTTGYLSGSGKRSMRTWKAGKVWGYQIEVDPTDRAWTGGFYEEGNRGWLVTLADNEPARKAFKKGDWNTLKVKALGNHFQTWINGVLAVDTTDDKSDSGFFGLQLHSINREDQVGKKVWWRNIRIKEL